MSRYSRATLVFGLALGSLVIYFGLRNLAFTPGPLGGLLDQLSNFTTIFLGIFIEAAPFLLLGTLASGLVEAFINQDDLARWIPRDPVRGALAGSLMGIFFPVCECGVVPLVRRLFHKGLPLSVGVAFLLAAPVFNPIVIASTLAAFGFGRVLWLRVGLTIVIAFATGVVFATQRQPQRLLNPSVWAAMAGASGLDAEAVQPFVRPSFRQGLMQALNVAADEFFEMGRYLVAGALLAALMQALIPQSALLTVSAGPVISVLALILLAIVLSVCSTVDAFIALAFAGTFTTGSILAFLVFGPMVDIKSTLMYLGVFRRRTVLYLVLLPLMMTILAAVAINLNTSW
jgi:uncharacterized membrane protein YraQ (UPF0718 family)